MNDLNLEFIVIEINSNGKPAVSVNDVSIVTSMDNKEGHAYFDDRTRPLTHIESMLVAALRESKAKEISLAPNEPYFVLLGRDPQAPALINQWGTERHALEPRSTKPLSAYSIARNMEQFKEDYPNLGLSLDKYNALKK